MIDITDVFICFGLSLSEILATAIAPYIKE